MRAILTAKEMRELDYETVIKLRVTERQLMELAGHESFKYIREFALKAHNPIEQAKALVVSGKGNNGGDGIVITRHLINAGATVDLVHLCLESELREDGLATLKSLKQYLRHTDRLRIFEADDQIPPLLEDIHYDFIVDAMLGTGYAPSPKGKLKSPIRESIEFINQKRALDNSYIIAIDTPSGLDCTSGKVMDIAVEADLTISLGFLNTGLFLEDGRVHCGKIELADISIPSFLVQPHHGRLIDENFVKTALPKRNPESAKHENGKVLLIAGHQTEKESMMGAALLSIQAAIAAGTGYVCASVPSSAFNTLHLTTPEAIIINQELDAIKEKVAWADAIAIGPGLGRTPQRQKFILDILNLPELASKKVVLDADALFALAQENHISTIHLNNAILTPHLKEFERLTKKSMSEICSNRIEAVREFASTYNTTLVLKGAPTLIASPKTLFVSDSGSEALATAGTGDVLTGIVVALSAKGLSNDRAAAIGAFIHGYAGNNSGKNANATSALNVVEGLEDAFNYFYA